MDPTASQPSFTADSVMKSLCSSSSAWAGLFGSLSQQSLSQPELLKQPQQTEALLAMPGAATHQSAAFAALFADAATSCTSTIQADHPPLVSVQSSAASLCDSATSFSFGMARNSTVLSQQFTAAQSPPKVSDKPIPIQHTTAQTEGTMQAGKVPKQLEAQLSAQPSLSLTFKQWQPHRAALPEEQLDALHSEEMRACLQPDGTTQRPPVLDGAQQCQRARPLTAAAQGRYRQQAVTLGVVQPAVEAIPPNKRARRTNRRASGHPKGLPGRFPISLFC